MSATVPPQLVYVVRLWLSESPDQPVWRIQAQNPLTGERHIFADLAAYFAFLQEQTQVKPCPEEQSERADGA